MTTESEEAKIIADRVLERPYADPDDDLAILARQYLRQVEANEQLRAERDDLAGRVERTSA